MEDYQKRRRKEQNYENEGWGERKEGKNQKLVSQSVTIHIFISGAAVYKYYLW